MNICLASMFRDSVSYLSRFQEQVADLRSTLRDRGDSLHLLLAEGDSTDGTYEALMRIPSGDGWQNAVIKAEHGGPKFGSVDRPERWRNIAAVMDATFSRVTTEDDAVIWIESDLIWQAETLTRLLGHLEHVDAVAPLSMRGGIFYDTWGFRAQGRKFDSGKPYHTILARNQGELVPVDSAGSCIVMRGAVARACRCRPADLGIVGFCQDVALHGWQLWCDPTQEVRHP